MEKTDGVPLYVEEMTKAILAAGVLQETDGHYEMTGQLASLAIPTTPKDSLMARSAVAAAYRCHAGGKASETHRRLFYLTAPMVNPEMKRSRKKLLGGS